MFSGLASLASQVLSSFTIGNTAEAMRQDRMAACRRFSWIGWRIQNNYPRTASGLPAFPLRRVRQLNERFPL